MAKVKATFEFWAENDAELSLAIGDIVTILNQDDPGWWEGELNGQRGLFPSNYVEPYTEPTSPAKMVPKPPAKAPAKSVGAPAKKLPGPPAKVGATIQAGPVSASAAVTFGAPKAAPTATSPTRGGGGGGGETKKLERKDTGMKPGPSMVGGKVKMSRTKFGVWSSNQAKISACLAIGMGAGAILWGGADKGINDGSNNYVINKEKQFYRIVTGCYAIVIGVLTLVYEKYWGARRTEMKLPTRGFVYLGLSVFFFYSEPTMTVGGFYVCIALSNFVATFLGESYDAPPKAEPKKEEEKALQSDSTWDALVQLAVMFKEQNKVGVMCFMIFYVCANIALFGYTVTVWIALNKALPPAKQLSGWGPYAKGFGKLLDLNCSLILLPVCRTMIRGIYNISTRDQSCLAICLRNVFAFMPLDRNLAFHKLVAKVTLGAAVGHTFFHFVNYAMAPEATLDLFKVWPWVTGGIICMSMLLIYSAAYDNTKRGQFEIFWYNHHFFLVFFGFILTHGRAYYNDGFWPFFVGPGVLYFIERVLRYMRSRRPVVIASVTMMKPCVFSIEFIKEGSVWENNDYKEGQYLFLQAPHISPIQWHPFTISSAPQERTVTVHIRVQDEYSWTYLLMKSFAQMGPNMTYFKLDRMGAGGVKVPGKILGPNGQPMLHIDGPHSAPTQHIGEYSTAMILGAGIGVTPVAATMKSVVFHRWKYFIGKAFPDNAYFYWVCGYGDIDAFRWFIKVIKDAQDEVVHMRATNAKSMSTKNFEVHVWVTSVPKDAKPVEFVVDDEIGFWGVPREDDKVDKHRANFTEEDIYRAMKAPAKHMQLEDVHIYNGRPDWNPRFDAVAKRHPTGDVGVCFCGNPFIAKDLAKACHTASHGRQQGIFILHKENF